MAFYGIQSAGTSIEGSSAADTIQFFRANTAVVSGNYILGLGGDDLIYLGPEGSTAVASATISGILSGGAGGGSNSANFTGGLPIFLFQSAGNVTGLRANVGPISGMASAVSVEVTGVLTSQRGVRLLESSRIYGNEGNDRIFLGTEVTNLSSTTLGGGAGDDVIGTFNFVNGELTAYRGTASTITKGFVEGGGGNDNIRFITNSTISGSTFQGSQGNDSIAFDNSGGIVNSLFAGGGGDDVISGSIASGNLTSVTVAGGGGNDSITLVFGGAVTNQLIATDTFNTLTEFDGNDILTANFSADFSGLTVQAGGGNDIINIIGQNSEGANYYGLGAGNDTLTATELSSDSVFAGAGNDTVAIHSASLSGYISLGGGNDILNFSGQVAGAANNTLFNNNTVVGGEGADYFLNVATFAAEGTIRSRFDYHAISESTLSAMDTVAFSNGFSGTTNFHYAPGGLSLASFSAAGLSGTNGIATFTGTFDIGVTARVSSINSVATTVGSTVAFADGTGTTYLFIQGGSTDLLIQNGLTGSGAASITLSDGKDIALRVL